MSILCKIRHYVDFKMLVELYQLPLIIFPFLSYSCVVWGNTYDHNIKRLQRIQKKVLRLLTFSNFDAQLPVFCF